MTLFEPYREMLETAQPVGIAGQVSAVRGLTVSVADFPAPVGAACRIVRGTRAVEARVIGFVNEEALVMPLGSIAGIARGDRVLCTCSEPTVCVGERMLGRVLDGLGRPVDRLGPLHVETRLPIWPEAASPMQRRRVTQPLGTGIRAIDAMLTVGRGQRMGIFSGPGVGKSILLGMIARYTAADVIVISLIGERGREVHDFLERDLGDEGLRRSVVVVSTGNQPPLVRVQAGAVATTIAEFFRDRGAHVLLLMDSLTRLAMAQRQIGLAAGEPPATKGYTPSVFNLLPELLERSGNTSGGSITGFYNVLVEGDDLSDPLSDAVRSVTDGHIWLSRDLAARGHYPAVDCLHSVSRAMLDVTDDRHRAAARELRRLMAVYRDIEDMLTIGAYKLGANADCDLAIRAEPHISEFLTQGIEQSSSLERTRNGLIELHERIQAMRNQPAAGGPATRVFLPEVSNPHGTGRGKVIPDRMRHSAGQGGRP